MKKRRSISKRVFISALSLVMSLGAAGTSWAGNVYGDDGSHIKVMTTAGEFTSLPQTDFNGVNFYLLPADAKIWVSSEGSTANPDTINFYIGVCPKDLLTNFDQTTDTSYYSEVFFDTTYEGGFEFDKEYPPFSEYYTNDGVYVAIFNDMEDGSWQSFFYMLDDGSYSVIPTETKAESGWKQDSTGWWYQNADGSYPKSTWQLIDGKYYYFNEAGYMLANTTTPDGYRVDESGAWIQGASAE